MVNKHRQKVVDDAVRRLRKLATGRSLADARGRVTHEGNPYLGEIRDELNKVYVLARAKAKKEASNGK